MPRRTGVQLLEWVRRHHPRTVRLLMTGHAELDDAVDAINRGHVYHYLLKPWRTQDLLQVLRNAADKFALEARRDQLLRQLRSLNLELEARVAARTAQLEEANGLLQQRTRELERLALTDRLTGLFNRRAMDELARFELKRHARYPSPLSLGLVDVDHFKAVNTEHLLTGGDAVLVWLGRVLAGPVREVDSVGRVGGGGVLVIARETGEGGGRAMGERPRAPGAGGGGRRMAGRVSAGFGVAEVGAPAGYEAMVEAAAGALAQAKAQGRNTCVVCTLPV